MSWDYVIVGSGFGGAVSACRLAACGKKVLVLERGRRWTPDQFPRDAESAWVWNQDAPEHCDGWIDLRMMDQMWVAQGAGVGGGSLIYANISIDAPEAVFHSGWPSAITLKTLKPYYAMVGDMLKPARVPENQWTERFKLMRDAAAAIGEKDRVVPLELAVTFDPEWSYEKENARDPAWSKKWTNAQGKEQGTCVHLGLCDIGCPVGAKNTLDLNYLAAAEASGATIQTHSLVTHVSSLGSTWRIHYDHIDVAGCRRKPAYVDAKRVILAAGSLGSTEILLRCRDEFGTLSRLSPHLGRGWSSNGDFLTPAIYKDRLVNASEGPTITGAIDFLDGSQKAARYFVEDGGFPNLLEHYINKRLGSASVFAAFALRRLKRMQKGSLGDHIMPWFGQAIDGADGRLYLGRSLLRPWRRRLKLDWNPDRSVLSVQGMADMHVKLTEASGGRPLPPLAWKYLRTLITPHPLGGCNMAASAAGGVVDDQCRVFGHDGLYVMDGSTIPRPIGLNPSKTIAAVAERAVERLCAEKD